MSIVKQILPYIGCVLLWSCSTTGALVQVEYPLFPPEELGFRGQVSQSVVLSRLASGLQMNSDNQEPVLMVAAWTTTPSNITLVGLTPFGQTLMQLSYDGRSFQERYFEQLQTPIPGREILSQLQLAYWPEQSIQQTLRNTDWNITTNGAVRTLYYQKKRFTSVTVTLARVDSHPHEKAVITNYQNAYQVQVDTLQRTPL